MRKNIFITLVVLIAAAAVGCAKHQFLPVVSPPSSKIFTVTKLAHTADSVNIGDTVELNATGTISDTSKAVYVFLTSTYSANGATVVQTFGTASSPIKVKYTAVAGTGGFTWTATITLIGATEVPDKTKLTIAATFQYQLSLSSELPPSLATTDAGQSNKTIYVR
jgi:hypothetical protein